LFFCFSSSSPVRFSFSPFSSFENNARITLHHDPARSQSVRLYLYRHVWRRTKTYIHNSLFLFGGSGIPGEWEAVRYVYYIYTVVQFFWNLNTALSSFAWVDGLRSRG
jgi:hypothetical protein